MAKHPPGHDDQAPGLSEGEFNELCNFLTSDACSEETMMPDELDGYLSAIVIGPIKVAQNRWLPAVWGPDETSAPRFRNPAQGERIHRYIQRHMLGIAAALADDADSFEPLLTTCSLEGSEQEYLDGETWALGFMRGVELTRAAWQAAFDDASASSALRPIHLLGAEEVSEDEEALVETPAQREIYSEQLAASVATLYRYWQANRPPRRG